MRSTNRRMDRFARALLCVALAAAAGGAQSAPPGAASPGIRPGPHLAAEGRQPPGTPLVNPFAGQARVAKAGATLFTSMNCDGCHGGDAAGWVGPNLGDGRWRFGGSDTDVFDSIFYGRPKGMPAFGGVLGERGVWILVTYLESLHKPADSPTESWPEP